MYCIITTLYITYWKSSGARSLIDWFTSIDAKTDTGTLSYIRFIPIYFSPYNIIIIIITTSTSSSSINSTISTYKEFSHI